MVDRSHPNLTNAVVVNWFTNNPEDMRLAAVAVGDFVQVQGMYVSSYKDSPQLNGSKHNSSFLVLHRKRSYHTGQFIETAGGEDVVSTLAATTNAQAKWDCYPPPEPNSPISEALIRTATKYTVWAETLLANNGLSDNRTNYSTLHGVRQLVSQLRRFAGPDSYNSLQPVGVLNLAEQRGDVCTRISDTADGTIVNTFRCDVVCIIAGMRLFKSSEGGENSISADRPSFGELLVWDGSTNGVLGELSDANSNSSSSEFSEGVDSRLQVARVYLEASRQNTQPLSEPSCSFNIWKALYTAENSMQNTILGSAITIKLVGESILEVASNLQVGMWVRIRGLHIDTPVVSLNSLTATAHADTHICAMYPYYW